MFCDNVNDLGQRGDVADSSHIVTVPYVDAITLDRRMVDYCRRACRNLTVAYDLGLFAPTKIFHGLAEWIN